MKNLFLLLQLLAPFTFAEVALPVKGMNLTEIGEHLYDIPAAQPTIDKMFALGVRHIVLNPRGLMTNPRSNTIKLVTPLSKLEDEEMRYARVIKYIKEKGGTVGIRPTFFVVDNKGNTPYIEIMPDGSKKTWWHGNIQPSDPNKWFESFFRLLKRYAKIAKDNNVEEFTMGAELFSMTVGIEDQWKEFPYGFPGRWLEMRNSLRGLLPENCRVMYDINFTDDTIDSGGVHQQGGELARWHYRIVKLAHLTSKADKEAHQTIVDFWNSLTAVGIDMYRSLATDKEEIPPLYEDLIEKLQETTDNYAQELHTTLQEIEAVTKRRQDVIFKEIGYRSDERGFIEPFNYAQGKGTLNIEHQAAAFEAYFRSFWDPKWSWYKGLAIWDASVDESLHGPKDVGFSPLGKELTESVISQRFQSP